jgi:outer membrane lipoprotein-sorting protein
MKTAVTKIMAVVTTALCATIILLTAQAQVPTQSPPPAVLPSATSSSAVTTAWAAFARTWTNITAYSATVTAFERKGTEVQNAVFDYTFHKPSSATVHYDTGPNSGVTAVWNGGNSVVAHRGSGLTALFKKTFALHDPAVTTIRGSSIDQLSFAAILAHAQNTPGPISESTGPVIDGVATEAVTLIPNSSGTDAALTREIVDISTTTNLPIRVLGYEGATLVRQIDFSNIKFEN